MNELYNSDQNLWYQSTLEALKKQDTAAMDWKNLIEEIEDMSASQKRALRSYTRRLIEHLLKLQYWHQERDRCSRSWRGEVINFRDEIDSIFKDSPSLKNFFHFQYQDCFNKTVKRIKKLGDFPLPESCFIQPELALDEDYFGE